MIVDFVCSKIIPDSLKPWVYRFRPYYLPLIGRSYSTPEPEDSAAQLYPDLIESSDVVVEVGAYLGGGTLYLSNLAKYVYSFEPVRMHFIMLRVNTRKCNNVSVINSAVGNENGYDIINLRKRNHASIAASLSKLANAEYDSTEKVKLTKLDDFDFKRKPTVLIIDCEGFEREVLRGAEQTIPTLRLILIETHTLADGLRTTSEVETQLAQFSKALEVSSRLVDAGGRFGLEQWILAKRTPS